MRKEIQVGDRVIINYSKKVREVIAKPFKLPTGSIVLLVKGIERSIPVSDCELVRLK